MSNKQNQKKVIYEGKAKILYEGPDAGTIIQHFKDDTTAFNGEKKELLSGKGVLNNRISEYIMTKLEDVGIYTHFIERINMREQLVKACEMIPIEIIVRNMTAGSLCKRFGVDQGLNLYRPMIEMSLKSDELNDPFVTEEHIEVFGWADLSELDAMKNIAIRVNDFLGGMFAAVGIKLADLKIEFGRIYDEEGNIYLLVADEISPDSCRLWDMETGEILDKDRFRKEMGGVQDAYREVAKRLGILKEDEMNVVDLAEARPDASEEKGDKKK